MVTAVLWTTAGSSYQAIKVTVYLSEGVKCDTQPCDTLYLCEKHFCNIELQVKVGGSQPLDCFVFMLPILYNICHHE